MKKYVTVSNCYYEFIELSLQLKIFLEKDIRMTTLIKNSERTLRLFDSFSTPEQKQNPYFRIVASEYPLEGLAIYTIQQADLSAKEIKQLIQLNRMYKKKISRFNWIPKAISGFIIAAGVLLLKQAPKEVFDYYGLSYTGYQVIVLWVIICNSQNLI